MTGVTEYEHRLQTWTLASFAGACQRVTNFTAVDQPAFAALGEALFWACGADEGYEALLGPDYKEARALDASGRLIAGVRWARNRMTHQRAMVIDDHHGTELGKWILGLGALDTEDHIKWMPSAAIPRGKHDQGRDVYDAHLAGKPVRDTIDRCRQWLLGVTLNELSKRAGLAIGELPGLK